MAPVRFCSSEKYLYFTVTFDFWSSTSKCPSIFFKVTLKTFTFFLNFSHLNVIPERGSLYLAWLEFGDSLASMCLVDYYLLSVLENSQTLSLQNYSGSLSLSFPSGTPVTSVSLFFFLNHFLLESYTSFLYPFSHMLQMALFPTVISPSYLILYSSSIFWKPIEVLSISSVLFSFTVFLWLLILTDYSSCRANFLSCPILTNTLVTFQKTVLSRVNHTSANLFLFCCFPPSLILFLDTAIIFSKKEMPNILYKK